MGKKRVLFLCVNNSCRSQMAEGLARALAGDLWEVTSAGTAPTQVNPLAVRVMAEVGIDISEQTAKRLDPDMLARADLVITLCGEAEEACPRTPPGVKRWHWPLPDPARAKGTEEEILGVFRQVRDEIRRRLLELLAAEDA